MSKRPNSDRPQRQPNERELDFEDFLDLKVRGSKKDGLAPRRRNSRGNDKRHLNDIANDPDACDEYMDQLDS